MTKKIILASHGRFASGMLSAAKMIIGELKGVDSFDLEDYESPYEIYKNIEHAMKQEKDTVYLILTDLLGGSVNNQLLELCTNKNVYVIAGANLGMLLELYLADDNKKIRTIIKDSVEASKQNIRFFGYPINDYVDHEELMEVNLW